MNVEGRTLPRLSILAGPAGIGKTHASLEHFSQLIRESRSPFVRDVLYLLPSAEHRERILDLLLRKDLKGLLGERVLTLNRLMQELLRAGDFSLATDAHRRFLLSEVVNEITAGQEEGYFSSVSGFPGFLEKISDLIGELKESMVSLVAFRKGMKRLERVHPAMKEKYGALLKIYEAYEKRLEARGLRDHRDGLFLLREMPAKKKALFPRFRHIFADGFFDFSRSQLEFLHWLAVRSERITLTLTVDLDPERKGLFEIPLETLAELKKRGFCVTHVAQNENQRASSLALRGVEKNIFREGAPIVIASPPQGGEATSGPGVASAPPGTLPRNDDSLLILEATGIRGEIEMIAREIRRLVRVGTHDGVPLHFSDIAVILRQIGRYEPILRAVFREFKIPIEIHERERLRNAPLAQTLASFFRIALDDWKREDLFNFLKSSYLERDYVHVCSLELRALELGIASGRKRWLEEIQDPLFDKINGFQERFECAETVEAWTALAREAIRAFRLSEIPLVYEEAVRRDFAALKRIENLLGEMESAAFAEGSPKKSFERFAREFLVLLDVDLFSLHHRDKNRVQVYDVSLARQKEYKVVFLAGLLEKAFPIEIREDPILSDRERKVVGLAERLPRQAVERYFFYVGLTRARERVILSYPRFDLEGHEALPSFYVDEVKNLFTTPLPIRSYPVNQSLPCLEDAVEEREIQAHLVRMLYHRGAAGERAKRALGLALLNRFLEKESFRAFVPRLLFDPAARIEDEAVRMAFLPKGGIFKPTGLELYGKCPYRYFASQVLALEEEKEGIDPKQVGILLHEVLENYWRERIEKKRKELQKPESAKAYVREKLEERLKVSPLAGEKAYRIALKRAQMAEWLSGLVEKEMESETPLAPRYLEFEFGFKKKDPDAAPFLSLHDPYREDLLLRGKIDRIDVDPSGTYALVIDYKTGSGFRRQELERGTALQLPLYLLAAREHLKFKPLGGEIYQINEAERKGFYSEEGLGEVGMRSRSRSVLKQKEFNEVLERAIRFAQQFAEGIRRAEIPVRPRDCDPHCPFPSVCRIEKWRLPFIYQEIRDEDRRNRTL